MRHGLGRIWQKNNRKKDDSTASGNGGSLFFSAISDTSVGTGTVGHAVCHNFWANDEADESASAFSQTPQCHSASHRGNSVAGGVTLDSGVLDARQPAGMDRQSGTAGAGVAGSRPGGCVAAWERLLVWTLRIWKIRSVADYRRGWIHWKKIFCRECFPSLCSMCSGSRNWEDFW